MTTTLPAEILEEIFLHLHPQDKIACMLACRHWKEIMEQYALYQTLLLYSHNDINIIVEKIQEQPDIASKVENVIIGFIDISPTISKLLFLLSNIKTLCYLDTLNKPVRVTNGIQYVWKKHIKYMSEFSFDGSTYTLLSGSKCPNLTTLRTDFRSEFINLFKNAPSLTTLVLNNFDGSFDVLETLHDGLPMLRSFKINYGRLSSIGFNEDVDAATLVTECSFMFDFFNPETMETELKLLRYICKKYPNLVTLMYMSVPNKMNVDMKTLNKHGWNPLFDSIALKLNKLSISTSVFSDDFFDIVDKSGCKINHLNFNRHPFASLENIVESEQTHFIQTLIFDLIEVITLGGFVWLQQFKVLEKLKLNSTDDFNHVIKLNDILDNSPPTLKRLSLSWVRFDIDLDSTCSYSIETLSFYAMMLPENTDIFVAQHFPSLSILKLKCCSVPRNTFNVAELDLFKFYFSLRYGVDKPTIVTVCRNGQTWYRYRRGESKLIYNIHFDIIPQHLLMSSFQLSTEYITDVMPNFILVCNSLKNVTFKQ